MRICLKVTQASMGEDFTEWVKVFSQMKSDRQVVDGRTEYRCIIELLHNWKKRTIEVHIFINVALVHLYCQYNLNFLFESLMLIFNVSQTLQNICHTVTRDVILIDHYKTAEQSLLYNYQHANINSPFLFV